MLLYVWSAMWEIECCQPEAIVGERWEVPVQFDPRIGPWFQPVTGTSNEVLATTDSLGVVELTDVKEIERLDAATAVAESSGVQFRIAIGDLKSLLIGQLIVDAHPTSEIANLPIVSGIVEAVHLVPVEYAKAPGQRAYFPQRQLAPIAVNSSLERKRFIQEEVAESETMISDDLLVALRTA